MTISTLGKYKSSTGILHTLREDVLAENAVLIGLSRSCGWTKMQMLLVFPGDVFGQLKTTSMEPSIKVSILILKGSLECFLMHNASTLQDTTPTHETVALVSVESSLL